MAQNEMKAKPALPERVRSMEGLGVTLLLGPVCMNLLEFTNPALKNVRCIAPELLCEFEEAGAWLHVSGLMHDYDA